MTGETNDGARWEIAPTDLGHVAMGAQEAAESSAPELTQTGDSAGATGPTGENPTEADIAIDTSREPYTSLGWD